MHENVLVPGSVIPARAWGIGITERSIAEIAADDPFGGYGVRLDIPAAAEEAEVADIQDAVGIGHIVLFPGICAWVKLEGHAAPEEVQGRWAAWLAAEGPPPLE